MLNKKNKRRDVNTINVQVTRMRNEPFKNSPEVYGIEKKDAFRCQIKCLTFVSCQNGISVPKKIQSKN